MSRVLRRFGNFYGRVIIKFMGIFIFIGILSVVFGDNGWMPNEDIYAISRFTYRALLPVLVAYTAGGQMRPLKTGGREEKRGQSEIRPGGVIAVMALAGMLSQDDTNGMLAAMVLGPLCGFVWENIAAPLVAHIRTLAEMLVRNLAIALTGCIMTVLSIFVLQPILTVAGSAAMAGIDYLVAHQLIALASVIIEPAKIFFLNNSIHHGILVPLALAQAERTGSSILFLLESNPGPGLGILLAEYVMYKDAGKRKDCAAGIFAEFFGGLHEVYFPTVLSNIWLVLAAIAGGAAGNLIFSLFGGATDSAVSPGSIIIIFFVTSRQAILPVLGGIFVSAAVSMACAVGILTFQNYRRKMQSTAGEGSVDSVDSVDSVCPAVNGNSGDIADFVVDANSENGVHEVEAVDEVSEVQGMEKQEIRGIVKKVGFICDAGVGSSAMAAALFRRKLKENQIEGVDVAAYAKDQIADDLDLAVCQADFKKLVLQELHQDDIHVVSNLLSQAEYEPIIMEIRERNGVNV